MIPKTIWQTYKTKYPPEESIPSIKSWTDRNPDYNWYYFDDLKCEKFIKDHFTDDFYQMYISLPIGVMKADVWRVAVVYVYGGIYADIDTVCLISCSKWITEEDSLIVGVETPHGAINNYVFASAPKHPALYYVLEKFLTLYNSSNFLDKTTTTPVQNFGAHGWSSGILEYYNLLDSESMSKGGDYYNSIDKVKQDKTKFFSYDSHAFSPTPNKNTVVHHLTGSIFWGSNYQSWRKAQGQMFGVTGL